MHASLSWTCSTEDDYTGGRLSCSLQTGWPDRAALAGPAEKQGHAVSLLLRRSGLLSVVQALARTCVRVYTGVVRKSTHTARAHASTLIQDSPAYKQNRSPSQCSEARSFLRWSTTGEIWRLQAVWGRARACLRFLVGVHARSLRQSDDLCFLHNRSRLKGDRQ